MTTFGDVRSAVHAGDTQRLIDALRYYDDTTPAHEVVAYIKRVWGWCPASNWMGSNGRTKHAVSSHICRRVKRLDAKIVVGYESFVVMSIERPEDAIQEALLPIRQRALDRWWQPMVDQYGTQELREVGQMLYTSLGDPKDMARARRRAITAMTRASVPRLIDEHARDAIDAATLRSPREVCTRFCGSRLGAMHRVDRHLLGAPPLKFNDKVTT